MGKGKREGREGKRGGRDREGGREGEFASLALGGIDAPECHPVQHETCRRIFANITVIAPMRRNILEQESRAVARKPRDAAVVLFGSPTTFITSLRAATDLRQQYNAVIMTREGVSDLYEFVG